jgi:hypothetical protein
MSAKGGRNDIFTCGQLSRQVDLKIPQVVWEVRSRLEERASRKTAFVSKSFLKMITVAGF